MSEEITQPNMIEMRQAEIDAYTTNIQTYTSILSNINGDWDEDLVHLKEMEGHESARQCPIERIDRLSELKLYQQLTNLLKTETFERNKAQMILNALLSS
jgi:hypothetical protein